MLKVIMSEGLPAADQPDSPDLTNFYWILRKWRTRVGLVEYQPELSEEAMARFSEEATEELDAVWPFLGDACVFSGQGTRTEAGSEQDSTEFKFFEGEAVSLGFTVRHTGPQNDRRLRILHVLVQESSQPTDPTARFWIDDKTANVTPIDDLQHIFTA